MGFYYLASPYTKYPYGLHLATKDACRIAARLVASGVNVFSPIVHSHPMTQFEPDIEYDRWMELDLAILDRSSGLIVADMEGWRESKGVRIEIDRALQLGLPIEFVDNRGYFKAQPEDLKNAGNTGPTTVTIGFFNGAQAGWPVASGFDGC